MKYLLGIVKLDLRNCKTQEDCKRLRDDNNIEEHLISDEKLFSYKNVVDIFYYDKATFNIIAIVPHGQSNIQFTDDFISFMEHAEPLKFKKTNLDLDSILDKISSFGLDSLNSNERGFLKKFSK